MVARRSRIAEPIDTRPEPPLDTRADAPSAAVHPALRNPLAPVPRVIPWTGDDTACPKCGSVRRLKSPDSVKRGSIRKRYHLCGKCGWVGQSHETLSVTADGIAPRTIA